MKDQKDVSYTIVPSAPKEPENIAEEPMHTKRVRYMKQTGIFLLATMGPLNFGMGLSWTNTIASDIQHDNSTLFGTELQLLDWQLDMISSLVFIGTLPGFLFGGWLVARFGRRKSMIALVLPCVIGWTLIALAVNSTMILIGRFVSGFSFALIAVSVRTYLSEISDTAIRGAAILTAECMRSFGAIIIIAFGMNSSWYYSAFFCAFEILFSGLVAVPFLPESPTYLTVTGKDEEARNVLKRLRGKYFDVETEMQQLKRENDSSEGSGWSALLKPEIMKKCLIVFGLFGISNFCGTEVIKANAVRILQTSGLSFDPYSSTLIIFILLLSGNIFQALLVDRIGRRKCLVLSLILLVISYTILGTYVYIDSSSATSIDAEENGSHSDGNTWNWIPTACLMVCAFSGSLGIAPTPWMLAVEYFPTAIRSQVMSVCSFFGSVMSFASLQAYSPLQEVLTPAGLYWNYACFAAIGIVYTLTIVQDTTGLKVG